MDKLRNIRDYITGLNNSELHELKEFIEHEIYLSELSIEEGSEIRK